MQRPKLADLKDVMKLTLGSGWLVPIGVIALIEAVAFVYYQLGWKPAMKAWADEAGRGDPLQMIGTFGDSFGAVNSLFSALALVGVALALFLQDRERRETAKSEADSRSLQSELATLNTLIHARTALFEERSIVVRRATDRLNKEGLKDCHFVYWVDELEQSDLRNVQRAEVERLIEASEERIGWQFVGEDYLEETRAGHLLNEAFKFEGIGNAKVSIGIYRRIIEDHDGTSEATQARERLMLYGVKI